MSKKGSKARGRPGPDANSIKHYIHDLEKDLKSEQRYMANTSAVDQSSPEDAFGAREGAARKLRFLKTWFDISSEAYITSLNLMDRFITKLKVKSQFLDCASISCMYIASALHKCPVSASDLVTISQVKCKVSDLERMSDIIRDKLGLTNGAIPQTAVDYLDHYIRILEAAAKHQNGKPSTILQRKNLLNRLEVVMLDRRCVSLRHSVVALALIQYEMGRLLLPDGATKLHNHSPEHVKRMWLDTCKLQNICMITPSQMLTSHNTLRNILQNYDNNPRTIQRKRMKNRYSCRWNSLKPSENFSTHLCVIRE